MTIPNVKQLLNFTNKVVIVTGASSGIGAGIVQRFDEAGASVIAHANSNLDKAAALAAQCKAAHAVQADLTTEAGVATLLQAAVRTFGRVDVLINNAGIYPLHTLMDMSATNWDSVINANLRSAFLCTQAFARQIAAQSKDRKNENEIEIGAAIVNITSIEAENPAPMHSHYNASKGGLLMLTKAAANELAVHGIRVNAVAPGLIGRPGIEQDWPEGVQRWLKAAPLGRLGTPEDVADACLFLASSAARWITGISLTVDGGVMTHQIF